MSPILLINRKPIFHLFLGHIFVLAKLKSVRCKETYSFFGQMLWIICLNHIFGLVGSLASSLGLHTLVSPFLGPSIILHSIYIRRVTCIILHSIYIRRVTWIILHSTFRTMVNWLILNHISIKRSSCIILHRIYKKKALC